MNEIPIVRRRSRAVPIVLTLLVMAILVLAGLWLLGMVPGVAPTRLDVRNMIEPAVSSAATVFAAG